MEGNSYDPLPNNSTASATDGSSERDIASRRNRLMRITQRTIDTDDDSSRSSRNSNRSNSDGEDNNRGLMMEEAENPAEEEQFEMANIVSGQQADEEARLFEDYIRERESTGTEIYNTELPTEHAYLGKLERVEGVDYLEPGKLYRMPIYSHHSVVYPGEIVPLMLNASSLYSTAGTDDDSPDGLKFGLVFQDQYTSKGRVYGVTCQVYERGDEGESALLKTIAQQRFFIVRQTYGRRAEVKILPEIVLPDPLLSSCSNAMVRYAYGRRKDRVTSFKRMLAQTNVWPKFVYDQYGTEEVLTKVKRYLSSVKITSVPTDPIKLSFWLARNIPLTEENRKMIFCTDSVLRRMLIINKALDHMWYFICKRCDSEIANYNDIFAMSKQGVQTSYCNPSGYVHDTLTVLKTKENSTLTVDRPSTDFSWFPGYSWQITVCANCRQHLGWKFVATKKNFLPKSFFGLSGINITVKSHGDLKKNLPDASDGANGGPAAASGSNDTSRFGRIVVTAENYSSSSDDDYFTFD
ncbi:protein cereblon [Anopheles aquasalis]|uniref:protein cereblon n=1 Tax=Anopheles aquasalis TaxID=42839 RepID=UPI00215B5317|nr:protein cereblon [Anopheles aquasalis]XP_050091141.1 protein cereblon [Anopheles aquasalis]XP_050091142.1 protein cereblon [Anopheles aquasalis]